MRKIYLSILACAFSVAVVAQDATTTTTSTETPVLKSKKGEAYLPVADEWGLGVSANPFLDYLGNFLNGTFGNDAPDFDFASNPANNVAVFGKLIKDENTAYRVRFNVAVRSTTNKAVVLQNELNPDPGFPAFADDWQKVNTTAIVIAPGLEKRRGSTRLQGIYGGELVLGFNNTKVEYDYGNAMSADFNEPITHDFTSTGFGDNVIADNGNDGAIIRVTEDKSGSNFLVGARGFIGIEYFFAPKISIGGEFGYMVGFQTQRRAVITAETWDGANVAPREVKLDEYRNGGVTSLGIGLDNLNGSINLLFYF